MKIVFTVILLLSSIADICLASDMNLSRDSQSSSISESAEFSAEEPIGHCNSPQSHSANSSSHQCHLGHCGLIFESKAFFRKFIPSTGKIAYIFVVTQSDIALKKRPPKSRV
ncbi:MAG: hypothetical protein AABZ31_11335 [Bdellovibrionota bacterium]